MPDKDNYPKLLAENGLLSAVIFQGAGGREIVKTFQEYARLIPSDDITHDHLKTAAMRIIDQNLSLGVSKLQKFEI